MRRKEDEKLLTTSSGRGVKQYKYLYRRMLDEGNIRTAYKKLRKGKTKRKEIQYIDAHLDEEVEAMRIMIENTRPGAENPELGYKPRKRKPKYIREHGKRRTIYMPEIHEQWLHHIIVLILEPIITATAYPYSCGSFPGRGAHYAKKRLVSWIRRGKGIRNFAKIDIRHFYESVRIEILMRELAIRIKDGWFLHVIRVCLIGFKKGIPLGFYISQWLANYLLEPLDYFITVTLGFQITERYMDDIVIMDDNKKRLHTAIAKIKQFLGQRFRLKLKRTWQVCKFWYCKGKRIVRGKEKRWIIGREIDYMGFLFSRERTGIRKSIMLSATRLAARMEKQKERRQGYFKRHIEAMLSYIGWFSCTDTYACYYFYIKPFVNVGKLKKIISKLDRRANQNERMETGTVRTAA